MSPPDASEQLDRLSEEFIAGLRAGERPDVEAFATRHPALADRIRRLFPLLVDMEGAKDEPAEPGAPAGTMLGEFRLVREIGRGGMGVVYEAVQETLDRRVALKVLPAVTTRDARYLERFRLEARAAGRLQHPNVVPVIGIGEHDGIHYFAMQYIEGRGIDELVAAVRDVDRGAVAGGEESRGGDDLVARLLSVPLSDGSSPAGADGRASAGRMPGAPPRAAGRTWYGNAARLVLQAADGVAAAHARGILHRDVKPSNLLVDEGGKVWITDFGLCKEEGSSNLTHPGDMLGTLRYIPPERLHGDSDVRGDVYGLGLTLYELVTLRAAYPEEDHAGVLGAIARGAPPRPRRIDPCVPRDLEAIVLRATARDRRQRYATAEALASDLRAWLAGRPIAARPPSFAFHLRAAIQRHKALTATILLAALALVASSVFYVSHLERKEADARFLGYVASVAAAEAALETRDVPSARRLLDDAPREWRGWEWHHLTSRLDPSLRTATLGDAKAYAVSYSPDGRWVAVAAADSVRILDDESGEERHRLDAGEPAWLARWSPRGDRLAVLTGAGLMLWSWPERRPVLAPDDASEARVVAWSGDGRRIAAGGDDGIVRVWDADQAAPIAVLHVRSIVKALDVDASGRRVVTGGWDGRVTLWDVDRRERVWTRRAATSGLHGVAFVGGDHVATPSEAPHVHIWSAADGSHVRTLSERDHPGCNEVRASRDGRRLVVGTNESVTVYDVETWTPAVTWYDGTGVRDLALHPSGSRVATVSASGAVREWGVAEGADPSRLLGHVDDVSDVAFDPSGRCLVSAGIGGVVRRWDARTGELLRVWIGHRWTVHSLAVRPDGEVVAAGDRMGDVVLWDVATDRVLHRIEGRGPGAGGGVAELAFSPDGARLYVAHADGSLQMVDGGSAEPIADVEASEDGLRALAVHPSGRWIVTGDAAGRLLRWEADALRPLGALPAHDGEVTCLAFDRTGRLLASAAADRVLRVWDVEAGAPLHVLGGAYQHDVAFSPDGQRLAAGARDGTVRLWDTATGRLVHTHGRLGAWVNAVVFSPDGHQLAAADGGARVHVWDARPLRERVPHRDPLTEDRARARALVEALRGAHGHADAVIAAIREREDLGPNVREAALRAAHRWRGTEDALVDRLWRALVPRAMDPTERWIARGLAADLVRAAGHRNRQDRRRLTLWGALTARCGDLELAETRIRRAMAFDEEIEPYLFAVDLAFLTLVQVGLERSDEAARSLARLDALLASHPDLADARLAGFVDEAREAVGP